MNPFRLLLMGNLILLCIEKQFNLIFTQNIYLVSSFALNIILIAEIGKISKLSNLQLGLFLLSACGLISAFTALDLRDFIIVLIKFGWIFSSIFLLNHFCRRFKFPLIFSELSKFAVLVGYFLFGNLFLTIIVVDDPFVVNEGFKSLLISSDNAKKLALMVIPFLLMQSKRHFFCGVVLICYLLLGTRALMLSTFILLLYVVVRFLKKEGGQVRINSVLTAVVIASFAGGGLSLGIQSRSVDITSFLSAADRLATWSRYSKVIIDYPFGLGPEGGYYLLRSNPDRPGLDISFLTDLAVGSELTSESATPIESLIEKRLKVSVALGARSAESLYLDIVASFGVAGFLVLLNVVIRLIKDFKLAISSASSQFTVIYGSLGALMFFGIFNSYHSSLFFVMLLYIVYCSCIKSLREKKSTGAA